MKEVDVLVIGAGPAGLSAAFSLLKTGAKVAIIEKENETGGLMRSVKKDDFTLDLGYKHLYNRIPEVHDFWQQLLGENLISYKQRTGVLYSDRIFEKDASFRGLRRGMPYSLIISALLDMLKYQLKYRNNPIISLEDQTYSKRGKEFTMIFSQGYDERIKGKKWAQIPVPISQSKKIDTTPKNSFWNFLKEARSNKTKQPIWFHPAKGTGQIVEELEKKILSMGGEIYFGYQATHIEQKGNNIDQVYATNKAEQISFKVNSVISSLPLEIIAKLMSIDIMPTETELSFKRGVVMVYLFLSCKASFPHNSIQVSSPNTQMSRITNYEAFGGSMVPAGKACICIEFFCLDDSSFFEMDDSMLFELAVFECEKAKLIKRKDCFDRLIIRRHGADPATSWEDYITDPSRRDAYSMLENCINLYHVNRTGLDKATYAGLTAAKAIITNDRMYFIKKTRPNVSRPWES